MKKQQPPDLALLAWACAELSSGHLPFLDAMASAADFRGAEPKDSTQHVADMVWSFAQISVHKAPLVQAIAEELADASFDDLPAHDLSNTVWALATLAVTEAHVIGAIAAEAETNLTAQHVAQFSPSDLANTAWAFAALSFSAAPLMAEMAAAAKPPTRSLRWADMEHDDDQDWEPAQVWQSAVAMPAAEAPDDEPAEEAEAEAEAEVPAYASDSEGDEGRFDSHSATSEDWGWDMAEAEQHRPRNVRADVAGTSSSGQDVARLPSAFPSPPQDRELDPAEARCSGLGSLRFSIQWRDKGRKS